MRIRIGKTTIRGGEVAGGLLVGGAAAQGGATAIELLRPSTAKPTNRAAPAPNPYDQFDEPNPYDQFDPDKVKP